MPQPESGGALLGQSVSFAGDRNNAEVGYAHGSLPFDRCAETILAAAFMMPVDGPYPLSASTDVSEQGHTVVASAISLWKPKSGVEHTAALRGGKQGEVAQSNKARTTRGSIRKIPAETFFKCAAEGCSSVLRSQRSLQVHQRKHTDDKPFACPIPGCGMAFKWRSGLKNHKRKHPELDDIGEGKPPKHIVSKVFKTKTANYTRSRGAERKNTSSTPKPTNNTRFIVPGCGEFSTSLDFLSWALDSGCRQKLEGLVEDDMYSQNLRDLSSRFKIGEESGRTTRDREERSFRTPPLTANVGFPRSLTQQQGGTPSISQCTGDTSPNTVFPIPSPMYDSPPMLQTEAVQTHLLLDPIEAARSAMSPAGSDQIPSYTSEQAGSFGQQSAMMHRPPEPINYLEDPSGIYGMVWTGCLDDPIHALRQEPYIPETPTGYEAYMGCGHAL
jgi:hypothetical protein